MKTTIYNYYSAKIVSVHDVLKFASYVRKHWGCSSPEALRIARECRTITPATWTGYFSETDKVEVVKELEGIVSLQFDLAKTNTTHEAEHVDYIDAAKRLKSKLDKESIDDILILLRGIKEEEISSGELCEVFGITVYA